MGAIKTKKNQKNQKKQKKILELDFSTAVKAPDYMQNSDKAIIVYFVDHPTEEGETITMADLLHKLNPEAKKAMKIA